MLTTESVLALAPDDSSAKAARGLVAPAQWPKLGASNRTEAVIAAGRLGWKPGSGLGQSADPGGPNRLKRE